MDFKKVELEEAHSLSEKKIDDNLLNLDKRKVTDAMQKPLTSQEVVTIFIFLFFIYRFSKIFVIFIKLQTLFCLELELRQNFSFSLPTFTFSLIRRIGEMIVIVITTWRYEVFNYLNCI